MIKIRYVCIFLMLMISTIALLKKNLSVQPSNFFRPEKWKKNSNNKTSKEEKFSDLIKNSNHSKDFSKLIDLEDFKFTLNARPCDPENDTYVISIVHTAVENTVLRSTIRNTWGSRDFGLPRVLFMMGLPKSFESQVALLSEQEKYGDMVQGNFRDTYRNLTYKSAMSFKWITYFCPNVKYVLKSDDDVFVHVPNLLKILPTLPTEKLIWGDVRYGAPVLRQGTKWDVSIEEYPNSTYPVYALGWAMVYSGDAVLDIYRQAQVTPYFWIDDVHMSGTLAEKVGVKHVSANDAGGLLDWGTAKSIMNTLFWPPDLKCCIGPVNAGHTVFQQLYQIVVNSTRNSTVSANELL